MSQIPADLRYAATHEWARLENDGIVTVGITDHAQEALGDETVEVSVGGGVVTMVMTGHQRLQSVTIQPDILSPDDVDMLQDLVIAAVNEAIERSQQMASERMGALTGGLGLPPGLI